MKRLDEIEARATAATEGPWKVKPYGGRREESDDEIDSFVGPSEATIVEQLGCDCCDVGLEVSSTDAEFIAHARQDVPALVAALRAVLEVHAEMSYGCAVCEEQDQALDWPCPTVTAIRQHLGGDA